MLHELAHLWFGSSGISDVESGNLRQEEVACNAVAGEFLAPAELFKSLWATACADLFTRLAELARRFHVSQLVVVRRALDLGLIDRQTDNDFYLAELERFRQAESQGDISYRNAGSKNSVRFANSPSSWVHD